MDYFYQLLKYNFKTVVNASWTKYRLIFKRPAGTSRGTLRYKDSWFIHLKDLNNSKLVGVGECGLLKGLSFDDKPNYESVLTAVCDALNHDTNIPSLLNYPSIRFGLEMAQLDLNNGAQKIFFQNKFSLGIQGIPINGLIWMGEKKFLLNQIESKIKSGFRCIKIKIGSLDFNQELSIIKFIRDHFNSDDITIRLDANGAFDYKNALEKLSKLASFDIHSIEQPIQAGLDKELESLCKLSPIPIALDESLIPIQNSASKLELLQKIQPQYIILKPSFVGGFTGAQEWIDAANSLNISWWITSALESNIGLNAIAQWTASLNQKIEQGLGTGMLYTNNISSPLEINNAQLFYNDQIKWGKLSMM